MRCKGSLCLSLGIGTAVSVGAWMMGARLPSVSSVARGAELVVKDGPRSPEEELKSLRVPAGFEVQLVAAEPDIQKPVAINFDERGRLWVSGTYEYPFAAPPDRKGRDTIKILDDFGPDGRARKITTFADDLNIPICVLPYHDVKGDGAIVYTIPTIHRFTDSSGAGRADKREVLLGGGIGHNDTHGMTGSFIEGFDGWIYACHGFSNTSTLKASDGTEITMQSGHTYRFRPNGSRVEIFTFGQVNPFGMTVDPQGNIFSSDCETKPICLLLRGSYYSSFGKPHDGLGFGPDMVDHMYGSTAIAGLAGYYADAFPAEYHDRMFVGNVVTSRINNCKLEVRGSAFHGGDEPDFVSSDDAWFRPVNMKVGPDGALYVSDFYNRIIGHYEVDLHHPGRDKQRGRIFRIVYKGPGAKPASEKKFDLSNASVPELIAAIGNANLTIRMLAMNHLADQSGRAAIEPLKGLFGSGTASNWQKAHAIWVLQRLGALDDATVRSAAADADFLVRVHAMKALAESTKWTVAMREIAFAGLKDANPVVVRSAADAVGLHPDSETLARLLELRHSLDAKDAHLLHTVRIAIRNHLMADDVARELPMVGASEQDQRDLADGAVGAASAQAGAFLLRHVQRVSESREQTARYLQHAARYLPDAQADQLASFAANHFKGDDDSQLALFKSVREGIEQRGGKLGEAAQNWGKELATRILNSATQRDQDGEWTKQPLASFSESASPWVVQMRPSADGVTAPFWGSLPLGEQLTGVLRSPGFTIPTSLRFFCAGHNGQPPDKLPIKNVIRLRLAEKGQTIAEAAPPRNDLAQPITWDLATYVGKRGYIEVVDGDDGSAYAWLAVGRFEPAVVKVPAASVDRSKQVQAAIEIVGALKLSELEPPVEALLLRKGTDRETRSAAARTLAVLNMEAHVAALAATLEDAATPGALRETLAGALAPSTAPAAIAARIDTMHSAPQRLQLALAKSLAATPAGAEALLQAIGDGKASARLLGDSTVKERLAVSKPADLEKRLSRLMKGQPEVDQELQKRIDRTAAAYDSGKGSPLNGARIFTANCAVCHSVDGQGAKVGPQLDGISKRGVPRIVEDILDPNRNVDAAFRYNTFVLSDGTLIDGIVRREEGETITVVDSTAKETTIAKAKVQKRVESKLSLMPGNMGEVLKPQELNDLLSFLMSK